jgi:hypothetical protein
MKKRKISYRAVAKRLNGVTIGPVGVSWTPAKEKREIIRGLLTFLEDRRSLFASYDREHGPWVVQSVLEIRKELTDTLKEFPEDDPTCQVLRTMRAACRKFLDKYDISRPRIYGLDREMELATHLGELRAIIGLSLAQLCASYKLDIEPELASILPASDK